MMTVSSIIQGLQLLKHKIEVVILTGGGRKNLFIKKKLRKDSNKEKYKSYKYRQLWF